MDIINCLATIKPPFSLSTIAPVQFRYPFLPTESMELSRVDSFLVPAKDIIPNF